MGRSRGRRSMLGTKIPNVDWRPSTHYLVPGARREECRVPWLRLILTHPTGGGLTYVGIDAHKKMCHATVMDADGTVVSEHKFPTNVKYLEAFVQPLDDDSSYAIEAGSSTKRLYWALKDMGRDVHMAHPLEVRRMMGTKKKTDREDSAFLADLMRMGRLPESYVPDREDDELRQMLRFRIDLGKKIIVVKNQVHALLTAEGVSTSGYTDIFGKGGREMLGRAKLGRQQRYLLDSLLQQLDLLMAQVDDIECGLAKIAQEDPAARSLMHIKGIGFYSALVILSEIGDVTRFPTAKHLTSYAGLVPRVHQSGDVARTGHIHKEGPKRLRSMMIQCAAASVSGPGRFQKYYKRLSKRKGHGKAIVATARKMLATVFVLLTRGCEYVEIDERSVKRKLTRMDRMARDIADIDIDESLSKLSDSAREVLIGERSNTNKG
jgi:transposase